jgi:Rad3-related DNA helicase
MEQVSSESEKEGAHFDLRLEQVMEVTRIIECKKRFKYSQHRSGFGKTLMNLLYAQYYIERGKEVVYICRDRFL